MLHSFHSNIHKRWRVLSISTIGNQECDVVHWSSDDPHGNQLSGTSQSSDTFFTYGIGGRFPTELDQKRIGGPNPYTWMFLSSMVSFVKTSNEGDVSRANNVMEAALLRSDSRAGMGMAKGKKRKTSLLLSGVLWTSCSIVAGKNFPSAWNCY